MREELLELVAYGVDAVGVAVMLAGFVFAVVRFVPTLWRRRNAIGEIQFIRCNLGTYLVFALELMIVSDLLHTVMSHRLEDLYFLGALVALRTLIAYFLNKEIQELSDDGSSQWLAHSVDRHHANIAHAQSEDGR